MRVSLRMALPALGSLLLMTACGPGYGRTTVGVSAQLGPGVDLYGYDATRDGDWHTNYKQWTPTTVYEVNGAYYPNKVSGGRQVQVYHSQTGYILPPRDQDLTKTDKRLSAKKLPTDADYGRARPRP